MMCSVMSNDIYLPSGELYGTGWILGFQVFIISGNGNWALKSYQQIRIPQL